MTNMKYGVITKVPPAGEFGNMALAQAYINPQATGGKFDDTSQTAIAVMGMAAMYLQAPVFKLGEILLLGANDRDQFGRKPSKWDVTCEEFSSAEEAAARAIEVTSGNNA